MTFVSYAQNFEDVMLWRALRHIEHGFYIDVGANDPELDSVTKAFYDRGWRGINIEPITQWFEKLVTQRPHDINLQIAAGGNNGESIIYELPDTGLSTMDRAIVERHLTENGYPMLEHAVSIETLTSIWQRFNLSSVHFLKIDVEGMEKDVLEGIDFSILRPWIIVIESTLPSTQIKAHEHWEPIICAANYEFVYFDGLNRFYIANEHEDLKQAFNMPPNIFDGFITKKQFDSELRAQDADEKSNAAELNLLKFVDSGVKLNAQVKEMLEIVHWTRKLTEKNQTSNQNIEEILQDIRKTKERVEFIELKIEQVLQNAAEAESRADDAEKKTEQMRDKIMQDRMLADLKVQLHKTENELHETQKSRQEKIDLVDQLKQELKQERQINHDHIELSEQLKQELEQVHQSNHHHWQLSEQLKQELEQVHQSNHHHWQLAEQRHQTITALKKSFSWRITWPVRFSAGLLVHPLHTLRTMLNTLLHGFIKIFNAPVAWAIKRVFSNKARADRINRWLLVNYPHLHQQLYSVAQQHSIPTRSHSFTTASKKTNYESTPQNQAVQNMQTKLEYLSPRALHIYHTLQTAITKHHQE